MQIIPNDLTKKFTQHNYPMYTGTDEWKVIKTDFEILDDAIAGTVAHEDYNKSIGFDKVNNFKLGLEKFKIRVDNYNPKDEFEAKEKEILQEKVDIGLDIYQRIIDSIK